jgi:nitrate reductase NapE component
MMDCREALQILEFDDLEVDGCPFDACPAEGGATRADAISAGSDGEVGPREPGPVAASSSAVESDGVWSADERAAARAHLAGCPVCERAVRHRRELDRSIGLVMRNVPVPRGAQQRLLAQLAELEAADAAGRQVVPASAALDGSSAHVGVAGNNGDSSLTAEPASSRRSSKHNLTVRPSRRKFLKSLVPLSVCVVVALVGFFGVVWLFQPSWSVNDVSKGLADLDFQSLGKLGDFTGRDAASRLPSGWDRLLGRPKSLPLAANVISVYGFEMPKTRQLGAVQGLIAVIPRNRVRNPLPPADSLAMASPTADYITARIGESVCVAWRQGDFVYVCLVSGGPDSLSRLQAVLEQPAA